MTINSKNELRQTMLAKRKNQDKDEAINKSTQAQKILIAQDFWKNATNIALYMPIRSEMQTDLLLQNTWESNKNTLLPRCHEQTYGMMDFFPCKKITDLQPGKFNILEPMAHIKPWKGNIDIMILPGLAFDIYGNRLGFGAGYYDRFLAKQKSCFCVGLAFAWQIINSKHNCTTIWNNWDIKVNAIVTEEGISWI